VITVFWKATVFPCWMAMDRLWDKTVVSPFPDMLSDDDDVSASLLHQLDGRVIPCVTVCVLYNFV